MSRKTEPIRRNQNRRKFFGRFVSGVPWPVSEHTAKWMSEPGNEVKKLSEGGFKRIQFSY